MPKRKDTSVWGVVFRDSKDPTNWSLAATGAGRKGSDTYGLPTKRISRDQGLGIKRKYKLGEHRDQYGSYGYSGKLPRKLFG